jgi:hypothetical protein
LATAVGSLPFTDLPEACKLIFQYVPEAPHWPQLPRVSPCEGMIDQFLEGAPGVVEEGGKVYLRPLEPYEEWERFYEGYEGGGGLDAFAISRERARGLYAFLEEVERREPPPFVKGQVTGPITLGLTLKDEEGAAAFFNQDLLDMLVKLVAMKARWQEETFRRLLPDAETIIFIDEPILSSYGSAFMNVSRDAVISSLREAVALMQGLRGVHICGNTDWPMIMETGLDIIDFDAYNHLSSFILYPEAVKAYLNNGGAIGWGIVPTEEKSLEGEESAHLARKLQEGIDALVTEDISQELLIERSLITPSCGAGSLTEAAARKVYQLTKEVSDFLKGKLVE